MTRYAHDRGPEREGLIKEKHDLVAAVKASSIGPVIDAMAQAAMREATEIAGFTETWEDQPPVTKDVWRLTAYAAMRAAKTHKANAA